VREVKGRSPIRIVIDKEGKLPENRNLFDGKAMTFVFNENQKQNKENLKYLKVDFSENVIDKVLAELYNSGIQSLIVEGGAKTLNSFISVNKWDEARVFTSNEKWGRGVAAPILSANKIQETDISGDTLKIFLNHIL
ncbi:MAG: dihydrofolate reductase family protein, partial [Bacteroidetes bacterium]|nr:dihydrofolate reductase family protein [Bacteroidota bacterium]